MEKEIVTEAVDHPVHYGGASDPFECIKVIRAWKLNFNLGNALKYLMRAGKKGDLVEDAAKSAWYLEEEIRQEMAGESLRTECTPPAEYDPEQVAYRDAVHPGLRDAVCLLGMGRRPSAFISRLVWLYAVKAAIAPDARLEEST